ncbi:MAG: response regulator transcription factor [Chitinophagales bacterium]
MNPITLAIADDHELVRKGLKLLLNSFEHFNVIHEAPNGKQLIDWLNTTPSHPNIAHVDVGMPIMNGFETTSYIHSEFTNVKIVALSVYDDEQTILKMIESGANAYLLKDSAPELVKETLIQVNEKGYYYSQHVMSAMLKAKEQILSGNHSTANRNTIQPIDTLTAREIEFIKKCCSEKTYKEIASEMKISQRTVDGYRESVFSKLEIKSRSGIVVFGFMNGLVENKG